MPTYSAAVRLAIQCTEQHNPDLSPFVLKTGSPVTPALENVQTYVVFFGLPLPPNTCVAKCGQTAADI